MDGLMFSSRLEKERRHVMALSLCECVLAFWNALK